jgi:hypothetical protein
VQTEYGGACIESSLRGDDGTFGFVDTLADYGGPWSFDSETMASISNQYAAMPSLHIGWATWCAFAVWPLLRNRWAKAAVLLYPAATLFAIVVTGNHYWIDGVGGLIVFGLGALIGMGLHRWNQQRLDRRERAALAAPGAPAEMPLDVATDVAADVPAEVRAEVRAEPVADSGSVPPAAAPERRHDADAAQVSAE